MEGLHVPVTSLGGAQEPRDVVPYNGLDEMTAADNKCY